MNKLFLIGLLLLIAGCGAGPGRLKALTQHGIPFQSGRTTIDVAESSAKVRVQYTGCGGLYILKGDQAIMIDPFFSNQKFMRIGSSMFNGKRKIRSDPKAIDGGLKSIEAAMGKIGAENTTVFSAHSHYDHLMDVPAVHAKLNNVPTLYVNQSGFNTCYNVLDTGKMVILENFMTTQEITRRPIEIAGLQGSIRIYPILAGHNAHFNDIKFFSGSRTEPVPYFTDPLAKTRVNDWLEGNTFSFMIDYLGQNGEIDFRIFVQSSSCNPMAGIPPAAMLKDKPVDVAFLGVASYRFSPDYPCTLMQAIQAKEIVWIHWEDFFRKYSKEPKTLRGTDVVKFFDIPCVKPYKPKALLPWPGAGYDFE